MIAQLKIPNFLLDEIRLDLKRPHFFAHERIGFLNAGATRSSDGGLILTARQYNPVDDHDYLRDSSAGAVIGPEAIKKGLQGAYNTRSSLIHVHTHGGKGRPEFSPIDLKSGKIFVPSFFNALPKMPHGILVLSDNSARGLLWLSPKASPIYLSRFIRVGAPYEKFGE